MEKKSIILDLDNTIYPVHAIGDRLFSELFRMISESGEVKQDMEKLKGEIMRRPFQLVARDFELSAALTARCTEHLQTLRYEGPIQPFEDYAFIRTIPVDRYLVTTGFKILQESKIDGMSLRNDFREIHIVDPMHQRKTKKDVFSDILMRHEYAKNEVLIVGDDIQSEIRAGRELGIDVILYDKLALHPLVEGLPRITDFYQLRDFL